MFVNRVLKFSFSLKKERKKKNIIVLIFYYYFFKKKKYNKQHFYEALTAYQAEPYQVFSAHLVEHRCDGGDRSA